MRETFRAQRKRAQRKRRKTVDHSVDAISGKNHSSSAPARDLQNILNGYNAFFDAPSTRSEPDDSLSGLPYVGMEADVASSLEQQISAIHEELIKNLEAALEDDATRSSTITQLKDAEDFEEFAPIIKNIKDAKRTTSGTADTNFPEVDLLLEYIACKTKHAHDKTEPHAFVPDDTPQQKQKKIEESNTDFTDKMYKTSETSCLEQIKNELSDKEKAAFEKHVNALIAAPSATGRYLQEARSATQLKLEKSLKQLEHTHFRKDLIEKAKSLNIQDSDNVAKFIKEIKDLKLGPNDHANEVDLLLQSLIIKRKQEFNLTHRVEEDDDPTIKIQKVAKFNDTFKKEMDDHLTEIQKKLKSHGMRIKRPEKYHACVKYLNNVDNAAAKITAKFDYGKSQILEQIGYSISALKKINDDETYNGTYNNQLNTLNAKLDKENSHENGTDEHAALDWTIKYEVAKKVQELHNTPENNKAFENIKADKPNNYVEPTLENTTKSLIKEKAEAEAKKQKIQATLDAAKNNAESTERQLEQLRTYKIGRLGKIHNELFQRKNPNPDNLKHSEKQISEANHSYREALREIHKKNGTYKLLKSVSAPLNALRGPLATESPRLPQLNITLDNNDPKNSTVIGLQKSIVKINELLEKREEMEATLASSNDPSLANLMSSEIEENTKKLSALMKSIAETRRYNLAATLLERISNIEEFTRKANRLSQELNNISIQKITYKDDKKGITEHTEHGTHYYEQDQRTRKWVKRTLRLEGNFLTDGQGKAIKDKDGNDIPLADEDRSISFTKEELANCLAEFCKIQSLNSTNGTEPKVTKTSKGIKIKWKNYSDVERWLKYLKDSYIRKLLTKANNSKTKEEQHEAKLDVEKEDSSDENSITATRMSSGA